MEQNQMNSLVKAVAVLAKTAERAQAAGVLSLDDAVVVDNARKFLVNYVNDLQGDAPDNGKSDTAVEDVTEIVG